MDVMEFFQLSSGRWRSQRTTHHLAFKSSEAGEFEIQVKALAADHPEIVKICQLHKIEPSSAVGGAFVRWEGEMAWDKTDQDNKGSTVFVLIPDKEHPRQGTLLRDQGYAENIPVAGQYHMDDDDGLVLTTEYDIMSSTERFWFASPNFRLRTSTVKRLGGFTTATFCTELRLAGPEQTDSEQTSTSQSQ